jgi:hypothetical protein
MGKLLEQSLKSLFNGVSRQPDTVRLPSQVEEADNVVLSVVSGGFERRPASRHVAILTGLTAGTSYTTHSIDRSPTEKYKVVAGDGVIKVFDALTGAPHTVSIVGAAASYLDVDDPLKDFTFLSITDYTFVVNRTKVAALAAPTTGTITGNSKTFNGLPGTGTAGQIYRVTGDATTLDDYFVIWDTTTNSWIETVDPNGANSFDASTMPHILVRTGTTTWDFKQATWNSRPVGNASLIPPPKFIGRKVRDVGYYKNRVAFLADEQVTFTQAGDLFNFWPDKATEVLDSDPVDVSAGTSSVTILDFAVPFRNSMFIQAENAQFEVSQTDRLTPKTASIELSTAYKASKDCRPDSLGDSLYFASENGNDGIVFEYFYDDTTISNTASDVTKHCAGYVPKNILKFAKDASSGSLFLITDDVDSRHKVFRYNSYSDGEKKVQSAWSAWNFGEGSVVRSISVLDFKLYAIIERGPNVVLESVDVVPGRTDDLGFDVKLDRKVSLTGIYDAVNNWTTWTLPYDHGGTVKGYRGGAFTGGRAGSVLGLTYPTSTTVRVTGNVTAGPCYFGYPFRSRVKFSKQYAREQDGSSIIEGRLQIRRMSLAYRDTGYFEVHVTPKFRETRVSRFTGRILGSGSNLIGSIAIEPRGTYRFPVQSRGDETDIEVISESILPFTIVSASWIGFFNETSRQG